MASICLEYWGEDIILRRTDDLSRSDRARPKAVLGVDAGGGHPPPKSFEFHIVVDEFWCIFMDQKSDETSKGISQEAISICHFSTICLNSFIYIVSLHSISSVRGVEWCRTMGDTGRTDDRRSVRLYSNRAGVVRRGRPSCNGGPGY